MQERILSYQILVCVSLVLLLLLTSKRSDEDAIGDDERSALGNEVSVHLQYESLPSNGAAAVGTLTPDRLRHSRHCKGRD
jgi:hypothetical protein